MSTALLIVNIVLCVAILAAICVLFFKKSKKEGTMSKEEATRLSQRVDQIATLSDYTARATENLNRVTEARLNAIQSRLSEDLKYIVDINAQNLERIRRTVDEKLTSSIDGKLSDSFNEIGRRLEKMYESVGEMKALSGNVADIKRVFSNVKLRGTWGEAQLDALLSQMLSPDQYRRNVKLNPLDNTLVDFAVLLPVRDGETLLPIDSKFPVEEFERLVDASERGDRDGELLSRKNLERAVKLQADSIAKKYINPPVTADFAIMYLPSEGLYSEVCKMTGLSDFLRQRRVIACGPTNLGALLSTLQTGFRTVAIEKRSGELREMLESFRLEFSKFAELLEKTRRKLQEAQDSVESAEKKTDSIGRRLDSFRGLGDGTDGV